jgi:DNA-binding response OmpR family regulator
MKKILLAEDDPFLVDIYQKKLKDSGFKVEVAKDGEKALEILKEKNFDLMLLDIVLPRIDGWKILEEIREMKKREEEIREMKKEKKDLEKMKIVIWSNLGEKEDIKKGLSLGATSYLIKANFTPSEVVREIEKLLK